MKKVTDKQKIDQFLLSNRPENTLLAYQLLRSQLRYGTKRALRYVVNYFFKQHRKDCGNNLTIAFGNILKISFNTFEVSDWAYPDIDSFLDYRIEDNTKTLEMGNYRIGDDTSFIGDLSDYKDKKELKEILDDFCLKYQDLMISKLEV
ncbi:MAG: hypothetical protein GY810_16385 [Aureispira sp.]|nr:hypothetical protein [Aureispira sp.]